MTALGEAAPLAAFPFALAAPAVRAALVGELKGAAFETWVRRRENQSLDASGVHARPAVRCPPPST